MYLLTPCEQSRVVQRELTLDSNLDEVEHRQGVGPPAMHTVIHRIKRKSSNWFRPSAVFRSRRTTTRCENFVQMISTIREEGTRHLRVKFSIVRTYYSYIIYHRTHQVHVIIHMRNKLCTGATHRRKYVTLSGTSELNLLSKKEMANCFAGSSAAIFDASRTSLATSLCLHATCRMERCKFRVPVLPSLWGSVDGGFKFQISPVRIKANTGTTTTSLLGTFLAVPTRPTPTRTTHTPQ